ncbi:MAG: peptidylprolyl isomerase [Burkholderiales bacterium RIFCSPLOWO2_02_FULL_57_36]|nr:MAG: peptidylprolyl isomerase [Burkholderiales bacterium RIFCSPLOWO2_02_FULL_57_36]
MLEYIRTHQKLMMGLLIFLIVPSFLFFGLEGYTRMGDRQDTVAKLAGQSITQQELDAAHRDQMQRFREMFGPQFDSKIFDTPEAKQEILDSLIGQKLLIAEATRKGLSVSDQSLQRAILAMPELKSPDGSFDNERYRSLLSVQNMNPAMFEARLRTDLALQQLNGAIQNSAFAPESVADRLSDISAQEREVQEMLFKASDFVSQVKITDQMLKDYYDKSAGQFEIPEQVKAEYVVLDAAAAAAQVSVGDADVKSYYEQNMKRYSIDEQRRASHILITANKDASGADKEKAKAKAESLLAQVRKNPGDFAKLAKEQSQDPGSAERGGDLGFFGKGMMVKPFEDAAYKLQPGEISDIVQSEFGYHIIQLTEMKPASVKSLDEVKGEIAGEIKKQLAAKKFADMAETFSTTVYENADSLKPVADKLQLKIETIANLTRTPNPTAAPNSPAGNAKFLAAIFSDEAIKRKNNTEVVEIAPNTLVAGRVVEHKPASRRPFDEVKAVVREHVTQIEAMNLAKKAGEAKLAEVKEKGNASGFSEPKMVSRAKTQDLRGEAFTAVMKADVTKLPTHVGVELPAQGYGVYRINKIAQPANADDAQRKAQQQQIANTLAQQEMNAYIGVLKNKAKVEIVKPVVKDPGAVEEMNLGY